MQYGMEDLNVLAVVMLETVETAATPSVTTSADHMHTLDIVSV